MKTIQVKDHAGSSHDFNAEMLMWSLNKFGSLEIRLKDPMIDPLTGERAVFLMVAFFCAPFCVVERD